MCVCVTYTYGGRREEGERESESKRERACLRERTCVGIKQVRRHLNIKARTQQRHKSRHGKVSCHPAIVPAANLDAMILCESLSLKVATAVILDIVVH